MIISKKKRALYRVVNLAGAASCGLGAYALFVINGFWGRNDPIVNVVAGGTALSGIYCLKEAVCPSEQGENEE